VVVADLPRTVTFRLAGGEAALPERHAFGVPRGWLSGGEAALPARHTHGVPSSALAAAIPVWCAVLLRLRQRRRKS
jgi:hypothetical protein